MAPQNCRVVVSPIQMHQLIMSIDRALLGRSSNKTNGAAHDGKTIANRFAKFKN